MSLEGINENMFNFVNNVLFTINLFEHKFEIHLFTGLSNDFPSDI